MIIDPCSAAITRSCYSGFSGIITRHVTSGVYSGGASDRAAMFLLHPGCLRAFAVTALSQDTAVNVSYVTGGVPGFTFLNGVAGQSRCVAACMRITWVGTELNRQGEFAMGCVPAGVTPSAATTIQTVHSALPVKKRVPDGAIEIRWNPSEEDESYEQVANAVGESFNEKNQMALTYIGGTGFSFSYVYTCIYEWTPRADSGQPAPTTVRQSSPAAVSTINNILAKITGGAHNFSVTAEHATQTLTSLYNAGQVGAKLIAGIMA